jgi:hypothetical protein
MRFSRPTRRVDVSGHLDTVRLARLMDHVWAARGAGLVLDLSAATVDEYDMEILLSGLRRVRRGEPVVVISPDPDMPEIVERYEADDFVSVA